MWGAHGDCKGGFRVETVNKGQQMNRGNLAEDPRVDRPSSSRYTRYGREGNERSRVEEGSGRGEGSFSETVSEEVFRWCEERPFGEEERIRSGTETEKRQWRQCTGSSFFKAGGRNARTLIWR